MDELANKLGIDPIVLRLKNAKQTGDPWLGGTTVESGSLADCLRQVHAAADWETRLTRTQRPAHGKRRGMGVAALWHTCGLLSASATVRLLEDGSVTVSTGAVDLGQGADTTLAQICCGVLGAAHGADQLPVRGHGRGSLQPLHFRESHDLHGRSRRVAGNRTST